MATSGSTSIDSVIMTKSKKDKQKYLIIDKSDNVEYIVKVKTNKNGDKVYKLFYSNADFWNDHVKGSLRLTMTDVGDGMKIKFADNVKLSKLDYADLEILRILTKIEFDLEGGDEHYRIVVPE